MPSITGNRRRLGVGVKHPDARIVCGLAGGVCADMLACGAKILRQPCVILETDLLVAKKQDTKFKESTFALRELQFW